MAQPVANEPEWFHPQRFSQEVVNYTVRMFSIEPGPDVGTLLEQPEPFKRAVNTVGNGVFCIQMIIRRRLRELFVGSMWLMAGEHFGYIDREIAQFMDLGFLNQDIFKTTITCFAVISELILFLGDLGRPVPQNWYFVPFYHIYVHRLKSEILSSGGWEELLTVTARRYIANGLTAQMWSLLLGRTRPADAELAHRHVVPDGLLILNRLQFGVNSGTTDLAMGILEELFAYEPNMIPSPDERLIILSG